ncbi:GGDEF domain-containing protein [Ramlibacter sp. 2FC]|uniref:GGDEF domain-containing protein n=1 Tax=Ramlibacter sp. 2FC TaxID=2502188 RepID=UPI001484E7D4|nr:GGDEF domain-containing protein [Ramlibacter sp. 2FC]
MSFDPRYLVVMAGFMSLVMSVVLFAMWRSYPRSIAGLAEWSAAPLLWCVAIALFTGRGTLPELLTVIAANGLLLSGALLFYLGSRRHFGVEVLAPWPVWAALVLAVMGALSWFTHVAPSFGARVGTMALAISAVILAHLHLLLRQPRRGFAVWLTLLVLGVQLLLWALRFAGVQLGFASGSLFAPSPLQLFFVGAAAVSVPLITIACVLVASDKLHLELEQMSRHDMLTRALTRRAVMQAGEEEIERSRRHGRPLSLLMLDLDNFKAVNDRHGHQHGDRILADFATRTAAQLRPSDRLGRYGGEEFMLLLPDTDRGAAQRVARRIHAASSRNDALTWTVSIGLTDWTGEADTLPAMLARADAALYQAKSGGRNCTQVA